ncbi:Phytanoyl-CoA dioxygenase (PhyH) [Monaibacterium marinum]|uniref:Phytanoyl-CoA dioxygenase (PhyH) n=1 Tax=Pontivivens marinum TaxID=1690039 RepID=A0A2C9CWU8_9RHOB|nr:phytanoyl-CoA dioxygenase family protein [Monaibacterium marinum]SOH95595.1 Phytanoyl-CoA dioxygenase (PhyH) [Monaibacterium marinum]
MNITSVQRDAFARDGFLVLRGFYDVDQEVAPIREGARQIVEALAAEHGVDAPCATAEEAMGPGLMALAQADRAFAGEVYDAVKQIPAFMQLVSDRRNSTVFEALREGSTAGLAAGGYGVRIDLPAENKFRALWHQEFPAQLRSPDGIVFWSPLLEITQELGPVQIGKGSHQGGIAPVYEDDGGVGKSGAYALRLANEEALLAKYEHVAPLSQPGDLILMDFLTLHQSGVNRSAGPRWSMQFRYFNFAHPVGRRIAWKGSFAAGVDFATVMPELAATKDPE